MKITLLLITAMLCFTACFCCYELCHAWASKDDSVSGVLAFKKQLPAGAANLVKPVTK